MKNFCRNCYHPLPYKAKFCAYCGQKNSDGKVPVSDVLMQLWFRILHLESRSWRVLWRLFVPGQVSIDYFNGKRKRYPPPVQFFFIIMFFFLFLMNHSVSNGGFIVKEHPKGYQIDYSSDKSRTVDLYAVGQQFFRMDRLRKKAEALPPEYRTPLVRAALDSVWQSNQDTMMQKFEKVFYRTTDSSGKRAFDSVSLGLGIRPVLVSYSDLFLAQPEQIIRDYKFTHWFDRLMVHQYIKALENPSALVKTFLGSLAWTMLALVAIISGLLTLLYRRQKRYYVEHFIFLLHQHTSIFLALTVTLSIHLFIRLPLSAWLLVAAWLALATLVSMRRYYRQGRWITFAKWILVSFVYFVTFDLLFIGGVLVAFAFF